jgi:hypothetical protein
MYEVGSLGHWEGVGGSSAQEEKLGASFGSVLKLMPEVLRKMLDRELRCQSVGIYPPVEEQRMSLATSDKQCHS